MGNTSGAAAAPAPKLRQARAMPSPLPPPAANPLHMPSPNSPLPHLTWPLSAGPQRPRNPCPGRADLAPGPRPGVAAWRPLPRGGLAARRPPPCVAPTSPGRPQPSPLAPTGPCARLSLIVPLPDRTRTELALPDSPCSCAIQKPALHTLRRKRLGLNACALGILNAPSTSDVVYTLGVEKTTPLCRLPRRGRMRLSRRPTSALTGDEAVHKHV
ncbi:uncharacterized protein LOC127219833 [Phodopus roborovskii]|uniref:uncharacterized protein LOC127219833 n=1 Tax=Phodopus roborovskii TaxID=109678 RepID=UPI0021E4EF4A|nr:uncharacterized protein LOC127219833 [Phodopus roborovskii]